jgi:hypothetical protein
VGLLLALCNPGADIGLIGKQPATTVHDVVGAIGKQPRT